MIKSTMENLKDIFKDNLSHARLMTNTYYRFLGKYQDFCLKLLKPIKPPKGIKEKKINEEPLDGIQVKGDQFLNELSRVSNLDGSKGFNRYEIGAGIGLNKEETDYIVENLSRAELIEEDKASDEIYITPYGIMTKKGEITVGYAPVHS